MLIVLNQDKTSESSSTMTLRAVQLACRLRQCLSQYTFERSSVTIEDDDASETSSAR